MKIDSMRRIDYWIGIPICFILSIFTWIGKKVKRQNVNTDRIKKILFVEFSELGSAILSYPSMKKAKERYPDSEIYFWIFESNKDAILALNIMPDDNIFTLKTSNFIALTFGLIRNLVNIWKEKIDVVIDMELFSRFSSIATCLTGSPMRIGFSKYSQEGLYRGNLLTHKVPYNPYIHISVNFLFLVHALKSPSDQIPLIKIKLDSSDTNLALPKLESSKKNEEHIWNKLKEADATINKQSKIVVIHPSVNEALPLRRWDFNNYLQLVKKLLDDPDIFIIMAGSLYGSLEDVISQQLQIARVINFIGKTTVQELIDLFNISRILISHDSGIIHIAALTNINILALFGPETPVLYAPLTPNVQIFYKKFSCSPCFSAYNQRVSVCNDNKCLQAISPEEIYGEAAKLLV